MVSVEAEQDVSKPKTGESRGTVIADSRKAHSFSFPGHVGQGTKQGSVALFGRVGLEEGVASQIDKLQGIVPRRQSTHQPFDHLQDLLAAFDIHFVPVI